MIIALSFIAALALTVVPLPDWLAPLRPEWVVLVLIYWCMALPERIGVGIAWLTGLLLDVLRSGLLGQHALSLAVVAYITLQLYQRLRIFPLWQQAFSVFILVLLHLMRNQDQGISGNPLTSGLDTPAFSSTLAWPFVLCCRGLRRRLASPEPGHTCQGTIKDHFRESRLFNERGMGRLHSLRWWRHRFRLIYRRSSTTITSPRFLTATASISSPFRPCAASSTIAWRAAGAEHSLLQPEIIRRRQALR